jgi:hypothetical protein
MIRTIIFKYISYRKPRWFKCVFNHLNELITVNDDMKHVWLSYMNINTTKTDRFQSFAATVAPRKIRVIWHVSYDPLPICVQLPTAYSAHSRGTPIRPFKCNNSQQKTKKNKKTKWVTFTYSGKELRKVRRHKHSNSFLHTECKTGHIMTSHAKIIWRISRQRLSK